MTTIFEPADRGRIVDALNLAEELNRPNSTLATLMTNRERDDVSYSVDRVGDIRDALDSIDCLQETLDESAEEVGVRRERIDNQHELEYAISDQSIGTKRSKRRHVDNIKKWLDPNNLLEAYSLDSRVIRTL